ncbi:MAG: D-2-hydroxyacid dehydrogenase [Spirochaetaceae bacterium]
MNIVILDAATLGKDLNLSSFNDLGEVTTYQFTSDSDVLKHSKNADVLVLNKVDLREKEFRALPKLKLICLTATGYNNIDTIKAKEFGITVCNVTNYSTESVAQHTFSMLLYQLQHLKYYDNYIKNREYNNNIVFTTIEQSWNEIHGKNWGIIGLGNIGRKVANIADAFGANIFFTSTTGIKRDEDYTEVSLKVLMKTCDIISIHAPLNNRTIDLISFPELELAKKNLIIMNLGRGGIINEEALAYALDNDQIKAACIDVLTTEPVKNDNPLINIVQKEKLFITPHIAWASIESRNRVISEICKNISAYFSGNIRNQV